mmetsp:Transcript_29154/g.61368  ORF Transcript_29154/g.61368 Transcript_29154/m.61368 type:complete len:81 (-) Transcript_29154:90-332(-)
MAIIAPHTTINSSNKASPNSTKLNNNSNQPPTKQMPICKTLQRKQYQQLIHKRENNTGNTMQGQLRNRDVEGYLLDNDFG